jgi:hypothetical protein
VRSGKRVTSLTANELRNHFTRSGTGNVCGGFYLSRVGVLASYESFFVGSDILSPLMAELNARGTVVFVHPAGRLDKSVASA